MIKLSGMNPLSLELNTMNAALVSPKHTFQKQIVQIKNKHNDKKKEGKL